MQYKKLNIEKHRFIEVTNKNGLKVIFSSSGAGIVSIYLNDEIMTVSPKHLYLFNNHQMYNGKIIGPIYGYLKDGKINIREQEYDLNNNYKEDINIHNGLYSLNNYSFSPQFNFGDKIFSCVFHFKKKKMMDGLPGKINYYVTYAISDYNNEITLDLKAISDAPTVISMTNHLSICLGSENLDTLSLTIPSEEYLEINPNTHDYLDFKKVDSIFDFQKKKVVSKNLSEAPTNGYENYYLLRKNGLPVVLENSKYRLEVESDYDGVHINTDNIPDEIEMENTSRKYHRGVVIAPNVNPLKLRTYAKNELYHHQIIYRFIKK